MKRTWKNEEILDIVTSFNEGVTFKELSKRHKAHYNTLKKVLEDNGVDTARLRKWTKKDIEDIISLYENEGLTIENIRASYKTRTQTIFDILRDNGVDTSKNERKSVNRLLKHDFFEVIDTEEKAYFLGMLLADGCVRKQGSETPTITLELIDLDVIEEFKKALNADSKISISDRQRHVNEKPTYSISIRSSKMAEDLGKFGVIPNKTYQTTGMCVGIPSYLKRHYLRGLFDGDGSLYTSNGRWFIALTSNYTSFLEGTQDWLQELIPELKRVKTYDGKSVARITYSGKTAKKVCMLLYKDTTVSMQRKSKLAVNLVEDIV